MSVQTLSLILTVFVLNSAARAENAKGFVENFFGNKDNYSMIFEADKATVYRIHSPKDSENPERPDLHRAGKVYEYTVGESSSLSGDTMEKFRELITNPRIDDPDSAKGCIPNYGIRVRYQKGDNTIDINLCFECDMMVASDGKKVIGSSDFDSIHANLVSLIKPLFPQDKIIQKLK